jgi:phosphatidylethanolamine-binding protein (PEBP) family uncharacterized protein
MARKTRRSRNKIKKQKGGIMNAVYYNDINIVFKTQLPVSFPVRHVDGGTFPIDTVQDAPTIKWNSAPNSGTFYTYICFDPDSSVPMWIHMLVANCTTASLDSGTSIFEWTPPSPPPGSGVHRYIFALYKHSYPVATDKPIDRGSFDLKKYIEQNGFIAVAGNSMKVKAAPT